MDEDYKIMCSVPLYSLNDITGTELKKAVAIEIQVGDKLQAGNPYSKKDCLDLERQLQDVGFVTRAAKNCESKQWSIVIIGKRGDRAYGSNC